MLRDQKYTEAKKVMEEFLKNNPRDEMVQNNLNILYAMTGKEKFADISYKKIMLEKIP